MPEREEAGEPQRYCRNCGAQVRADNAFCVSCGARLNAEVGRTNEEIKRLARSITPARLREAWVKLTFAQRVFGVGVVLVVFLLFFLSPIAPQLWSLVLVVSAIGLGVRLLQRRPAKAWGATAALALVFILVTASLNDGVTPTSSSRSQKDGGTKEKKATNREGEIQDRVIKSSQATPPNQQVVVPDPATTRYNEQVQNYNKQVQEHNRQTEEDAKRLRDDLRNACMQTPPYIC